MAELAIPGVAVGARIGDETVLFGEGVTSLAAPTPVAGASGYTQVDAGDAQSCGLLADGTVRCWGYNGQGEIGDGTLTARATPTEIAGGRDFVEVDAGALLNEERLEDSIRAVARSMTAADEGEPGWTPLLLEFWAHASRRPALRTAVAERRERFFTIAAGLIEELGARHGVEFAIPPQEIARGSNALARGIALDRLLVFDAIGSGMSRGHRVGRKLHDEVVDCGFGIESDFDRIRANERGGIGARASGGIGARGVSGIGASASGGIGASGAGGLCPCGAFASSGSSTGGPGHDHRRSGRGRPSRPPSLALLRGP